MPRRPTSLSSSSSLSLSLSLSETAASDAANGIVRAEISLLSADDDDENEHTATSMTRSRSSRAPPPRDYPTPPESEREEPASGLTSAARVAQLESLLRDPQLANEMRAPLLTQLGAARRTGGAQEQRQAPAPRVPPRPQQQRPAASPGALRVSPDRCPVCRESFRIYYEQQNVERAQAASRAADTGTTERARAAVLSNGETISDQYKKIFRFEDLVTGMMNDNDIIHNMVLMHRALIEKPAQKLGLRYTPWTHEMLREHFDVANEHIFDPIREIQRNLRMTRELSAEIRQACMVPDPDNPARRVADSKAIQSFERIVKEHRASIQELKRNMQSRHNSAGLQAAMMQLVGTIGGLAERDTLRTNPRVAAGTMERGGDALRTAGKSTSQIGGTQADLYALSGFQ
jgi:hypothetical protein